MWTNRLTATQAQQVLALAERAAASDGTPPLNEEAHFALSDDSALHLLEGDDDLRGYLQWHPGHRTAQLVVDPARRRRGIGRGLLDELTAAAGDEWAAWAFGDLPAARGLASALGLAPSRGLLIMERGLAGVEPPVVPDGLTLRGYTDADATELLAVNAAAFAHHPEQGALDADGLAARMSEPWFDPEGLILGFDADGLAGFHWTKQHDARTGEVYVVGVAPRTQGRGYGKVLLRAGLAHLRGRGADHVLLYVDMAEPVAVRMYESAGFHVAHRDVLYAHEHGSVQKQEQP
ncbi:MAG: mycothiol synthase [Propionicimonas sp.]|uniref:mycothiol synthase n=1 Tax=Propionicimonas sp. TaxID=1955623 RepID=UPI003D111A60